MKTKHDFTMTILNNRCIYCNEFYEELLNEIEQLDEYKQLRETDFFVMSYENQLCLINTFTDCLTQDERIIKGIIE